MIFQNTVYLDLAIRRLRRTGEACPMISQRILPLRGSKHISFTGDYFWGEIERPRESLRPLQPGSLAVSG